MTECDIRPVIGDYDDPAAAGLPHSDVPFPASVGAFMFEVSLYGMYIVLFITCILNLLKNKPATKRALLASATTMFAISTANVCMSLYIVFGFLVVGKRTPISILQQKYLLYIINSIIADSLMISRCYVAWSNSKFIIIFLCLLLILSICGFIFASAKEGNVKLRNKLYIYLWLTLALNVLVTSLTAVRIWWTARNARKILGPGWVRKYYFAIAVVVESGAIYSLYVLLDQVLETFVLDAGLCQIAGIVSTLIIVQVGTRRHARAVETTVSHTQEARGPSTCQYEMSSASTA